MFSLNKLILTFIGKNKGPRRVEMIIKKEVREISLAGLKVGTKLQ